MRPAFFVATRTISTDKTRVMSASPTQAQSIEALVAAGFSPGHLSSSTDFAKTIILRHSKDPMVLAWVPVIATPSNLITVYRREKDYPKRAKRFSLESVTSPAFKRWVESLVAVGGDRMTDEPPAQLTIRTVRSKLKDALMEAGYSFRRPNEVTLHRSPSFQDCCVSMKVTCRGSLETVLAKLAVLRALDNPKTLGKVQELLR